MYQKTTTVLELRFILCLENKTARLKKQETKPGGRMAKEVAVLGFFYDCIDLPRDCVVER